MKIMRTNTAILVGNSSLNGPVKTSADVIMREVYSQIGCLKLLWVNLGYGLIQIFKFDFPRAYVYR